MSPTHPTPTAGGTPPRTCPLQPRQRPPASLWRAAWRACCGWWPWKTGGRHAAVDALQQCIDAVVGIDHRNRVVFYNAAAARLWGHAREQVLGANVSMLVPRQWRDGHDRLIERHRQGGENRIVGTFREVPIERADGTLRWVSLAISQTVTRGRIGYTAFVRDVTADRDARETMVQTLEQAIDAVVTVDAGLRITYCNPAAEQLWGRRRDELLGRHARILLHDEVRGEFDDAVGRDLASAMGRFVGRSRELRIPRADGQVVWGRISVARLQIDERTSYTAFVKDITETRAIRLAKEASEHRLKQLLENLPNVALMGCGGDLRITYWNRAAESIFGYPAEEAMGRSIIDLLMPPELQQSLRHALEGLRTRGEVLRPAEVRLRHRSGQLVTVQANNVALNLPGQPLELFSACVDLSGREAAESSRQLLQAQLRESQKMEALGTLAGGVAHDFNNIVAAILGNVELALLDVPEGHAARESLHEVRKAGRRARDLVQQILTFSRRQTTLHRRIDLQQLLADARAMLHTALPPGVSLVFDIDPRTPEVSGDPTQLEQVLLNLCTNAAHALEGRSGGRIAIGLHPACPPGMAQARRMIDAAAPASGLTAALSVRDDGSGMDEATLARIFEPFFTTKPTGKGTGLGLPVVHGILRDHGASLDVQSAPGAGTAFCIRFPGLPGPAGQARDGPNGRASDRGFLTTYGQAGDAARACHLVYVDDDEAIALLMERMLRRAGYRVSTFTDPAVALARIAHDCRDVDVVLTDHNMPGMNGIDLTRALQTACPDLPVLMTTGHITDGLRTLAPQVGVRELIYKPDSVDGMFLAVHQAVRRLPRRTAA